MQPTSKKRILIFGLGNYPLEYQFTPHNAGFLFLEVLSILLKKDPHLSFTQHKTNYCKTQKFEGSTYILYLIYPITLMNRSNLCAKEYYTYLNNSEIFVAHDDLDIPLGKYKFSFGKTTRGHNGVLSIIKVIPIQYTTFIRIGIDTPYRREKYNAPSDYLLTPLPEKDWKILTNTVSKAAKEWMESNLHPNIYLPE